MTLPGHAGDVGYKQYAAFTRDLHSDRITGALFIPFVLPDIPGGCSGANTWVGTQTTMGRHCRGLFFVTPGDDPQWVRNKVHRLGLHGLKCYHTFSGITPTWEASISEFLPESLVAVANDEDWVITLHIVKRRAVADPDNIQWLRRICTSYPNMRLILAHSARGFQPAHNLERLPQLTGLGNLYFDTSANCEPTAHQAIIRFFGHERLMYGSDLPVSHQRGHSLGAADMFLWLDEHAPVWQEKHQKIQPILLGLEHLRSIKWACWAERLSDKAVEDIFFNNAAKLFNLRP